MNLPKAQSFSRRLARPLVHGLRYARNRARPRESYAADWEDVAVSCLLGRVARFIDIGANDGITGSNTFRFALFGARGLCFEPDPVNYLRLNSLYRLNSRVVRIAEGISSRQGICQLRCDGLLSTIPQTDDAKLHSLLEGYRNPSATVIEVPVSTLANWFKRFPKFVQCDLLSIDVEGHELEVLRGIDWAQSPIPARCIVVETHANSERAPWSHRDLNAISELLVLHQYRSICKSANNTIWLHTDSIDPKKIKLARDRIQHYSWLRM